MAEALPGHVEELLNQIAAAVPTSTENLGIREGLLRLLLSVDHISARNLVEELLKEHGTVRSAELSLSVLGAANWRLLDYWPTWLGPLQVAVCQEEDHQRALDALVAKAIREATREESEGRPQPTDGSLDIACEEVARLREAKRAPPEDLAGALENAVGVASDPTTLSRQVFVFSRLRRSALKLGTSLELLEPAITPVVEQQLKQPLPEGLAPGVLELLDREIPFLVVHFSSAFAETVREAFPASPWLVTPYKEQLDMAICGSLASRGQEILSPIDADSIGTLSEAHGPEAAALCAHWVREFSPSPSEIATALATYIEKGPPTLLRSALETRSSHFTPSERLQCVRGALRNSLDKPIHSTFLDAIGFPDSDQTDAANELISLFGRSTNEPHRETVMALWGSLKPTDEEARAKLIEGIFIPMLKHSRAGFMVAYKHLPVAISAPRETIDRMKATLLTEAEKYGYKRKVQKKLYGAGLLRRRRSFFGDQYE